MSVDRFAVIQSRQTADFKTILHVDHPKCITA